LTAEAWLAKPAVERGAAPDLAFSRDEARQFISLGLGDLEKGRSNRPRKKWPEKNCNWRHSLKWLEKTFDDAPDGKPQSLDHDARGARERRENDRNWRGYFAVTNFRPGSHQRGAARAGQHLGHVACEVDRRLFDRWLPTSFRSARGPGPGYLIGYSAGATAFTSSRRVCPTVSPAQRCAPASE